MKGRITQEKERPKAVGYEEATHAGRGRENRKDFPIFERLAI
jgi:hypothetical protein